ncbi:MAG TPA: tetratricopeptide repeat protein [Ktedonobacteraceae bacterium]
MPRNSDNDMEFPDMSSLNPGEMLNSLFSLLGLGDHQAEEAVRNFFTAWSEGNYESAYGQLASNSPLREGLSRKDWSDRRRAWVAQTQATSLIFDVALPPTVEEEDAEVEVEVEDTQSRIIDIKTALAPVKEAVEDEDEVEDEVEEDTGPKQVEAFWSLEIPNPPVNGETLPEIPASTLVLKETGNHWFWTSYTLALEDEQWRIQEAHDEGAIAILLSVDEIQELQTELIARIGELAEEAEEDEEDEDEFEEDEDEDEDEEDDFDDLEFAELAGRVQETMWLTLRALYYSDVLFAKQPDDPEIYEGAYNQASQFQQFERAAAYAQIRAERLPDERASALRDYAVAMMNQCDMLIGEEELDDADKLEIIEHYTSLAERALITSIAIDDAVHSHILFANVLIKQNTRLEEAESHLQQLKSRELNDLDRTYISLGEANIARLRGDVNTTLAHYQEAAALSPNIPHIWFNIGHFQRELGELDEAQKSLIRSIEEDPQEVEAYAELAAIYTQLNEPSAAQELLEDGLELNPDSVDLLAALSLVHTTRGDLKAAEEFLDEAEEIDSSHYLVEQAREQFEAARARQRQQQKNKLSGKNKSSHQQNNKKKK